MGNWIKAKRCRYNGRDYRSNAEGKCAESLDRLGASWTWEGLVGRGPQYDGGQYTPDFFVPYGDADTPEHGTVIEVAGVWDARHQTNAAAFMRDYGLVTDEWRFDDRPHYVRVDGDGFVHWVTDAGVSLDAGSAALARCHECGQVWAVDQSGTYECPNCGAHDGDHHLDLFENLFDAAGVRRYEGR